MISTAVRTSNLASYVYCYIIRAWGITKYRFELEVLDIRCEALKALLRHVNILFDFTYTLCYKADGYLVCDVLLYRQPPHCTPCLQASKIGA